MYPARHLTKLILWAVPVAGLACGGDGGTDIVLPPLRITTVTSGVEIDPDGYSVSVDGQAAQPIGLQATVTVDQLTDGAHSVELLGVAPNCTAGENPRAVTTTSGATATVAFAVTCATAPSGTGNLEISVATSGVNVDPDAYQVSLDGGAGQAIGANATITLANISAAEHVVQLVGLAPNCAVTGPNPLGVAVLAGETATIVFAVTCLATAGELSVTITGLPQATPAAVTVSGPNNFSQALTANLALTGLAPGSYTVRAANVVSGTTTYTPSIARPTVDVVAGGTTAVTVSYTAVANNTTLNLRIDGLYVTQSSQTYGSTVSLVAGRDAYLRVFVVANEPNTAKPTVRVRLSRSGRPTQTFTIEAPGASTPTEVQEGVLGSSWNLLVPGASIHSVLSIVAEVDPNTAIAESNETDNRFPATGTKALTVAGSPPARIRFVSVQQGVSASGNVSNPDQLMALARRMHPLNAVEVDVRSGVFTASEPLQSSGAGWDQVLGDLDAERLVDPDGENWIYFGIAKLDYGRNQGTVGIAFRGVPSATTALGWDDPDDASRVVAHELGHIWGRKHSPCGNPPDVDAQYRYPGGQIGVYGLDVTATDLRAPSSPDIMSYCFERPWISDYTYQGVMDFRKAPAGVVLAGVRQPSLLVRGRIVNGRPILEPAFEIVTRPSLPSRPGPYSVSATGVDGSRLFALSFDVAAVEDDPAGTRHFAFAVPLNQASASRLASLRLDGPSGSTGNFRTPAQLRIGPTSESIVARREGQNVSLRWNAAVYPMIMVRDPDTGEVLSFARGGTALVRTAKGSLDLDVSDGVRSQRLRVAINRS